jgi:4-hydroxybenzoate polyprenyltransferase
LLRRLFDFFLFSSLFIAACALLMVYQTAMLFHLDLPLALYGFVFSGSVCSYNFHWYLTPPVPQNESQRNRWNSANRSLHIILFGLGILGAAVCSFLLIEHWLWLGVTAFTTFLYSAPKIPYPPFNYLRKIAIGKTIFLSFAWAHVTALLPLVIRLPHYSNEGFLFVANRFLFIYAICILFDYRDVEEDRKAGIRSLITLLSERGIGMLFWSSLALFTLTSCLLVPWFGWIVSALLFLPAVILACIYSWSKKNFSDYLYYFILDGLMMLSAPLLLLFKFVR